MEFRMTDPASPPGPYAGRDKLPGCRVQPHGRR
jgi:hypothetical protein